MCLAQGHNTVTPVKLEPAAPWSPVKHSTTELLRSHTLGILFQSEWSGVEEFIHLSLASFYGTLANSLKPDQTPCFSVWSGSTLFAYRISMYFQIFYEIETYYVTQQPLFFRDNDSLAFNVGIPFKLSQFFFSCSSEIWRVITEVGPGKAWSTSGGSRISKREDSTTARAH